MKSKYLNSFAIRGLEKSGDVYIPGDKDLSSFSESGFIKYIDRQLENMEKDDIFGLNILLSLFSFFPQNLLVWSLKMASNSENYPGFIKPTTRLINMGLKGLSCSLYYSGLEELDSSHPRVMDIMKWNPKSLDSVDDKELTELIKNNDFNESL